MKKQIITIVVILGCLLLLGGAWLALSPETDTSETEEASGELLLWQLPAEELSAVAVANEAGGYSAVCEAGSLQLNGMEGLPTDASALSRLLSAVTALSAEQEITDGGGRLADFGLEEPACQVRVLRTDGTEEALQIGSEIPGEDSGSRYVNCGGQVYVVSENSLAVFFQPAEDFLDHQVTPAYDSTSDSWLVTRATVTGAWYAEPVSVEHQSSQELAGYQVNSYALVSPLAYPVNSSNIETWLDSFFNLTADSVAAVHPTAEELASCGLANPWARVELTYEDSDGVPVSLAFSASQPQDDGTAYVSVDGVELVYRCQLQNAAWAAMSLEDLVSREILVADVRTLDSLVFRRADGVETVLELVFEEDTEEYQIYCEGQLLDKDSFKNFYYLLISQNADEVIFENLPETDGMEPLVTVSFRYRDGQAEDVVEYYAESDRTVYAAVNGTRGCRLVYTQLTQVLEALQQLINGESVEARY